MDLNWFRDLSHLASTANFSQAAVLSNVSQPTLSRRIRSLENWAGVTLVDRSHQPVQLTEAGQQMLEAAEQAIERLEAERRQLLDAQTLPHKYMITFGAQHSIGWRFYPSWLQAFEDAYGPILSRLRADDLPNCLRDLREGQVDYVIAYQTLDGGDSLKHYPPHSAQRDPLESIRIGSDRLVPVCKPGADGKPEFAITDASADIPFLSFGTDSYLGTLLQPTLRRSSLTHRLKPVYENSMAGALRIRARDGLGLAWLPHSLVAPDIQSGLLCQLQNTDWQISMNICLTRNKANTNQITRAIWAFLARRQAIPLTSA